MSVMQTKAPSEQNRLIFPQSVPRSWSVSDVSALLVRTLSPVYTPYIYVSLHHDKLCHLICLHSSDTFFFVCDTFFFGPKLEVLPNAQLQICVCGLKAQTWKQLLPFLVHGWERQAAADDKSIRVNWPLATLWKLRMSLANQCPRTNTPPQ